MRAMATNFDQPSAAGPATSGAPGRGHRRGLTLLEVLISIFVLSIGLLGVAALVPVGKRQIQQGSQYDRAAACGRAGMNQVLVGDYLNPEMWMSHLGNSYGPTNFFFPNAPYTASAAWIDWDAWDSTLAASPTPLTANPVLGAIDPTPIALGNSVCIDPLFIARNFNDTLPARQNARASFPFHLDYGFPGATGQEPDVDGDVLTGPVPPRMQRATLRVSRKAANLVGAPAPMIRFDPAPPGGNDVVPFDTVAERLFTWQDEVVFELPAGGTRRPVPNIVFNSLGQGIRPARAAEYSWFATLTPTSPSPTPLDGSPISYRISVVVCFKRDLNWVLREAASPPANQVPGLRPAPKERMVCCEFLGGGLGGGPARLWLPVRTGAANNNPVAPDRSDLPRVRPGQWIMLSAWRPSSKVSPLTAVAEFKWYRVAAADNEVAYQGGAAPNPMPPAGLQGRWYQDVTLQGSDWNEQEFVDPDGDGNYRWPLSGGVASFPSTWATIVEGVVGVYEANWTWTP